MSLRIEWEHGGNAERVVAAASAAMKRGGLVLLPTESVYVLATDAFSARGTSSMRRAKGYDDDAPLGILVPSISTVSGITQSVPNYARDLMDAFWPGLLTLLLPAATTLSWDAAGRAPVAVRMPLHPAALAVIARVGPVAVSAAPASADGAVTSPEDVEEVSGLDLIVSAGQAPWAESAGLGPGSRPGLGEIRGTSSTVIDATGPRPIIRRAGALSPQALRDVCIDL